jgi:RNA polymerase sigma-70 factor (ECF subfamily)
MMEMDMDAENLARAACRGDRQAVAELINLFYPRVYAFLRRMAGHEADAADLTQKTFSRVWQALPSFAERSSISSWIHGIAYHVYLDWRRANSRYELRTEVWWEEQAAATDGPDAQATQNELAAALYASVDALDTDLRDTVHLHYYQGLTLQETADAMKVSTSTVKNRLRQALEGLQKRLAEDGQPAGTTHATRTL